MKKVRLSEENINIIKKLSKEIFGKNTKVFLFGSRVYLDKKGGDIDLYLIPEDRNDFFEKKLKFLVKLKQKIGDRKIDLIIQKDRNRPIEKEALLNGVEL